MSLRNLCLDYSESKTLMYANVGRRKARNCASNYESKRN